MSYCQRKSLLPPDTYLIPSTLSYRRSDSASFLGDSHDGDPYTGTSRFMSSRTREVRRRIPGLGSSRSYSFTHTDDSSDKENFGTGINTGNYIPSGSYTQSGNYTPKFIVKTLETKKFCQIKLSEINLTSIAGGSPVKSIHLTVSRVHDIGPDSGERGLAAVWWVEERRVSSSNSKRTFRFL